MLTRRALVRPFSFAGLAAATFSALAISLAGAAPPATPATPATPTAAPPAARRIPKPAAPAAAPVYDETADVKADIAKAVAKAKRNHTRVLIQWGANWCGWCKLLHATWNGEKDLKKTLLYEYEVVFADVGHFDKNVDLVTGYGADLKTKGLPYLTVLDADGKVVVNQETSPLEMPAEVTAPTPTPAPAPSQAAEHPKPSYNLPKLREFLTVNAATPPKAADVLAAGLERATKEKKSVFLHFGAPWCGWCHKLEDWMARPDVTELLAKDYVDVKIDTDRFPGGADLLAKYNESKAGGIPWFVILDASGKALVNSTSPKGNTGFPSQPEEIAWFIEMLKKTAKNLTPAEIATIEGTLKGKTVAAH